MTMFKKAQKDDQIVENGDRTTRKATELRRDCLKFITSLMPQPERYFETARNPASHPVQSWYLSNKETDRSDIARVQT